LKAALLQALVSGSGYGLDLIERVRKQTNGEIVLRQGTVYPLLRGFESAGLVESRERELPAERGGRPRRYYRLTLLGAKVALEQREVVAGLFGALEAAR